MVTTLNDEQLKSFSERLNHALDEELFPTEKRQYKLSALMGVTPRAARKWLFSEGLPNTKKLETLCAHLNISLQWLLTGKGSMRPTASDKTVESRSGSKEAAKLVREINQIDKAHGGIPTWAFNVITSVIESIKENKK